MTFAVLENEAEVRGATEWKTVFAALCSLLTRSRPVPSHVEVSHGHPVVQYPMEDGKKSILNLIYAMTEGHIGT